jgi:hypothetical protein
MILLVSASPAVADMGASVGWEGDARRGSGFAGVERVFEYGTRKSLVVSASGSLVYYRVFEDGEEIRVSSVGGALDLALTFHLGETIVSTGPGIQLVRERSVLDSGLIFRDWSFGPTVGVDLEAPMDTSMTFTLAASYTHPSRYFWARSTLFMDTDAGDRTERTGLSFGIEVTAQGNGDIRIYQVGPVFDIAHRTGVAALRLRAGFSALKPLGAKETIGGYLGAEITYGSAAGDPG